MTLRFKTAPRASVWCIGAGAPMVALVRAVTPDVRRDIGRRARRACADLPRFRTTDTVEAARASFARSCPQKDLTEDDTSGSHGLMRGSRARSRQLAPVLHVSLP